MNINDIKSCVTELFADVHNNKRVFVDFIRKQIKNNNGELSLYYWIDFCNEVGRQREKTKSFSAIDLCTDLEFLREVLIAIKQTGKDVNYIGLRKNDYNSVACEIRSAYDKFDACIYSSKPLSFFLKDEEQFDIFHLQALVMIGPYTINENDINKLIAKSKHLLTSDDKKTAVLSYKVIKEIKYLAENSMHGFPPEMKFVDERIANRDWSKNYLNYDSSDIILNSIYHDIETRSYDVYDGDLDYDKLADIIESWGIDKNNLSEEGQKKLNFLLERTSTGISLGKTGYGGWQKPYDYNYLLDKKEELANQLNVIEKVFGKETTQKKFANTIDSVNDAIKIEETRRKILHNLKKFAEQNGNDSDIISERNYISEFRFSTMTDLQNRFNLTRQKLQKKYAIPKLDEFTAGEIKDNQPEAQDEAKKSLNNTKPKTSDFSEPPKNNSGTGNDEPEPEKIDNPKENLNNPKPKTSDSGEQPKNNSGTGNNNPEEIGNPKENLDNTKPKTSGSGEPPKNNSGTGNNNPEEIANPKENLDNTKTKTSGSGEQPKNNSGTGNNDPEKMASPEENLDNTKAKTSSSGEPPKNNSGTGNNNPEEIGNPKENLDNTKTKTSGSGEPPKNNSGTGNNNPEEIGNLKENLNDPKPKTSGSGEPPKNNSGTGNNNPEEIGNPKENLDNTKTKTSGSGEQPKNNSGTGNNNPEEIGNLKENLNDPKPKTSGSGEPPKNNSGTENNNPEEIANLKENLDNTKPKTSGSGEPPKNNSGTGNNNPEEIANLKENLNDPKPKTSGFGEPPKNNSGTGNNNPEEIANLKENLNDPKPKTSDSGKLSESDVKNDEDESLQEYKENSQNGITEKPSLLKKIFKSRYFWLAASGTVGGIPFAVFVVLIPGVIVSGSSFIGLVVVTSKEVFKHLKRDNNKNKKPLQALGISKSKLIANQNIKQRH